MYLSGCCLTDEGGSQLHCHSSPQLYMQAYEIADDYITDLLATGQLTQRPAVLETAERGTHIAVCIVANRASVR